MFNIAHRICKKGDAKLQKDIKNFVRKALGPIAIPSDAIFVADIPRNKAGKPVCTDQGQGTGAGAVGYLRLPTLRR